MSFDRFKKAVNTTFPNIRFTFTSNGTALPYTATSPRVDVTLTTQVLFNSEVFRVDVRAPGLPAAIGTGPDIEIARTRAASHVLDLAIDA